MKQVYILIHAILQNGFIITADSCLNTCFKVNSEVLGLSDWLKADPRWQNKHWSEKKQGGDPHVDKKMLFLH